MITLMIMADRVTLTVSLCLFSILSNYFSFEGPLAGINP